MASAFLNAVEQGVTLNSTQKHWLALKFWLCLVFFALVTGNLLAQTDAELESLLRDLDRLQQSLNNYRGQFAEAERSLQQQEIAVAQNHRDIFNSERSLVASQDLLTQLELKAAELADKRDGQEALLRDEIAAAYRSGPQEPLKLLLNREDSASFSRMLFYYRSLVEQRELNILSYESTLKEIAQNSLSKLAERDRQSSLLANLTQSRSDLEQRLRQREEVLQTLERAIADTEQEIASKEADRERLESLVRNISTRMAELNMTNNQTPFDTIRGSCAWPASGRLTASFGAIRTGTMRWDGVMIAAAMGDSVQAVHYGRVVFADYLRGYGLLIIIDHGDNYLTLYGHNQSLFVEAGNWVTPGQNIAQVGNSGGLRDAALYFEIRKNGEATDPARWCH